MSDPTSAAPRSTGELASRINDVRPEAFDLSASTAPTREAVTATLIDTDEPFETMEFASSEFISGESSSSFALDTNEPILDFERSELFESRPDQDIISFDTEQAGVLEVDLNQDLTETQNIETTEPDISQTGVAWDKSAAESSLQAPVFDMTLDTAFEATNENGGSSLLAAEDPLGNVLEETVPFEPFADHNTSSNESMRLELTELEAGATEPVTSTQFSLVETAQPLSSQDSTEVKEQVADHQAAPAARSADWTSPRAGAYSTAQLDSVVMPIETAAYLARGASEESAQSEVSHEPSFTAPARWTEEEARFTAIDIEAVSVEEPAAHTDAYVPAETAPHSEDQSVSSATEPGNGASAHSELSAAAIQEIVSRVIAEMSDSVVREVAWEVVPDCVERVVDQLTRESLPKRT
jgi:hypothetical protein